MQLTEITLNCNNKSQVTKTPPQLREEEKEQQGSAHRDICEEKVSLFALELHALSCSAKQNAYAASLTLSCFLHSLSLSFSLSLPGGKVQSFERTCKRLKTQSQQIESLQQQSAWRKLFIFQHFREAPKVSVAHTEHTHTHTYSYMQSVA